MRAWAILLVVFGMKSVVAAPACPVDAGWPPPFRFEYDVRATRAFVSLRGDSTLALTREAQGYTLNSETSAGIWFGARQSSRGRIRAAGMVPVEYIEHKARKPQATTRFDWGGAQVSFSATDKVVPTQPGMQDRLSLLLQLGWTLRSRAETFDLPVAGVRGSSIYRFLMRGPETVETPAGRFQTLKLERAMDADSDRIEVWLAPSLCSLPVRIRFTDRKGLTVDNELKSARFAE